MTNVRMAHEVMAAAHSNHLESSAAAFSRFPDIAGIQSCAMERAVSAGGSYAPYALDADELQCPCTRARPRAQCDRFLDAFHQLVGDPHVWQPGRAGRLTASRRIALDDDVEFA